MVVFQRLALGLLLRFEQFAEDRSVEVKQAEEVLPEDGVVMLAVLGFLDAEDAQVVALDHFLELFDHGVSVRLGVSPVVPEIIYVICIAGAIDLHSL